MNMILMSFIAGVIGMGLGGVFTAIFGTKTDKMTSIFLSFAGGVMISIVFLELVPESMELSNLLITIIGLVIGVLMVYVLHYIMDKLLRKREGSELHDSFAEFFHSNEVIDRVADRKSSMFRSGLIMIFAIGLHNVPEGLAMGAAGQHDTSLGIALAIIIALHNIPEGMAVSVPLMVGGLSRLKSVFITAAVGATTVIGAVAGVIIGGISDIAVAMSFSIAGGAMLYVVVGEMLPQSIVMSKDRIPTVFALLGTIAGMLFIELVH